MWRGWFSYIVESALSATFSHPDRYLADSPVYDERSHFLSRLAGNEPLRSDRVKDIKIALAGGPGQPAPDWHDVRDAAICRPPPSLTHIYLSDNPDFTMEGVESMFRFSRGHIQHFDCASPAIATGGQVPFTLAGIVGRSHLFRPVFASNLQSLRIHHSLVTHIPTLNDPSKRPLVALEHAETVLRKRAEMACPQAVVPDLNPRLQSLTLTCLPRVSAGPLIDKLIGFLVSAADQEDAIRAQQSAVSVSRRGPTMLRGLRHIRLEFAPYPPQDEDRDDTFESLDAKALLDSGTEGFTFFGQSSSATATDAQTKPRTIETRGKEGSGKDIDSSGVSGRSIEDLKLPGIIMKVSVWVGSGRRGSNKAVNAYMDNLSRESLRTHIRPATPDQVKAGVPVEACVYNAAWDAILWLVSETEDDGNENRGKDGANAVVISAPRPSQ
ncbi:hypothetical protein SBRCBS47491_002647 [Sporothrix bragantina]|uniref:Uncharacterized protein n=1 Tax=Sporothrix bragantina TaxID=671064 RepID=A0ABP0B8L0_9PEZI